MNENWRLIWIIPVGLLIGLIIGNAVSTTFNHWIGPESFINEHKCYAESVELWNSVNNENYSQLDIDLAYEKNNRQACALMYYEGCLHGQKVQCSPLTKEEPKVEFYNWREEYDNVSTENTTFYSDMSLTMATKDLITVVGSIGEVWRITTAGEFYWHGEHVADTPEIVERLKQFYLDPWGAGFCELPPVTTQISVRNTTEWEKVCCYPDEIDCNASCIYPIGMYYSDSTPESIGNATEWETVGVGGGFGLTIRGGDPGE